MSLHERLLCPLCDHPFLVKEAFYKHVPSCYDIQVKAWEKAPEELRGAPPELPPHFQDLLQGPRWHHPVTHIANANTDGSQKRPTAGGRSTRIERTGPKPPPTITHDAMLASTRAASQLGRAPKSGPVAYDDKPANEWLQGRLADDAVAEADALAVSVTARAMQGTLPQHTRTIAPIAPSSFRVSQTFSPSATAHLATASPVAGAAASYAVGGAAVAEAPPSGTYVGGAATYSGTATYGSSGANGLGVSLGAGGATGGALGASGGATRGGGVAGGFGHTPAGNTFGQTHVPIGYTPVVTAQAGTSIGVVATSPMAHAALSSPTATHIRGQTLASLTEVGVKASPTNHPFITWQRSPQWFTDRNQCAKCGKFYGPYNPRTYHMHIMQCWNGDFEAAAAAGLAMHPAVAAETVPHRPHSRYLSGPSAPDPSARGGVGSLAPMVRGGATNDNGDGGAGQAWDATPEQGLPPVRSASAGAGAGDGAWAAGSPSAALRAWRGGVSGGGIYDNVGAARSDRVAWRVRPATGVNGAVRSHASHVRGPLRGTRSRTASAPMQVRRTYPTGLSTASGPGAAAAIQAGVDAHNRGALQPVAVAVGGGGARILQGASVRGPNDPRDVLCAPKMSTCGTSGATAGPAGAAGAGISTKEATWAPGATSPGSRRGQRFSVEQDGHANPVTRGPGVGGGYGASDGTVATGGTNAGRNTGTDGEGGPFVIAAVGDINVCATDPCNGGPLGHLFKRCDFCGTSLHISALAPHVANCMARPTATATSPNRRPQRV